MHLDIMVEEPSMKIALNNLLPRVIASPNTFRILEFEGKKDLLANLPSRLRGYRRSGFEGRRIMVLLDKDRDECHLLKQKLEEMANNEGLGTKTNPISGRFVVVNRIVIEELEAWFFGDVNALCQAFPGVPPSLASRARFRDPDAICDTWEALEIVLHKAGYYCGTRLPKMDVAERISSKMDPSVNRSASFKCFWNGVSAAIGQ